jgi:N-acetylglutamate synthase-like GNAT family acetyltransferase
MTLEPITINDFPYLAEFEPPGWGDLIPRFSYAISSSAYHPFKLEEHGITVAIGTVIYHADSAWLASIIVHPDHRNKGYGKKITQAMIDGIDTRRYTTIYLDATDLGFPVYKKLGFIHEADYVHFKSENNVSGLQLSASIIPYRDDMLSQLLRIDKNVSCEDRKENLLDHLQDAVVFFHDGKVTGYYLPSFGNGVVIAENSIAGVELLKYRLENNYYAIFPSKNRSAIDLLQQTRLKQFRVSRRMFLGVKRNWQAENIYNRISGQLG